MNDCLEPTELDLKLLSIDVRLSELDIDILEQQKRIQELEISINKLP
jgi:hypothetical protein